VLTKYNRNEKKKKTCISCVLAVICKEEKKRMSSGEVITLPLFYLIASSKLKFIVFVIDIDWVIHSNRERVFRKVLEMELSLIFPLLGFRDGGRCMNWYDWLRSDIHCTGTGSLLISMEK
jgi:hypothetical protein